MTRNVFFFLGAFVLGAVVSLVARAAMFKPHAGHQGQPETADYAPMVTNRAPSSGEAAAAPADHPADPHAGHSSGADGHQPAADPHAAHSGGAATTSEGAPTASATPASETVNTICAICGMPVDRSLQTLEYKGQKIGFGCKLCAPKFKANPDRYGPAYLRNQTFKR